MFSDTPYTPFDTLYMCLNMMDRSQADATERFIGLQRHAPNGRISLLVIWWLALRRTMPLFYERDLNPPQMLKDCIYDLIQQEEPLLNRRALRRIQLALTGLNEQSYKGTYANFIKIVKPLLALPDAAVHTHAIVMKYERVLLGKVCKDNQYHMYWRRFCLIHNDAWERSRGVEKWPSALLLPVNKSVRTNRRLGLFDDPEANNLNMDTLSLYGHLYSHNEQEALVKRLSLQELSLVWPFDSAEQVPMYDVTEWFELSRPDQDYQYFAYASGIILTLLAWQIGRRCLRHRSLQPQTS